MIVFDDIKLQLQSILLKNMFVATFMAWPCSRIFMPSHQCCNFSVSQFHNICNGVTEKLDCIFYNQKKYCDQIIYPNNSFNDGVYRHFLYEYRYFNIHMTEQPSLMIIELWNVELSFYDNTNERLLSSRVITKTLLLDQSWTQSFLIRYKRWKQNIYDIQRRVKKQT